MDSPVKCVELDFITSQTLTGIWHYIGKGLTVFEILCLFGRFLFLKKAINILSQEENFMKKLDFLNYYGAKIVKVFKIFKLVL